VQVWNINGMTQQDYDNIASIGVDAVELQLYWSDIEPSVGTFDFTTLYANVK
jgi:beta-galactosidase GanA